ncbi:MAG: EamA family transporter, partial [Ruminococcus sp.]|nr:EamA family transporter [Ruminococcus sp.]
DISSKVDYYLKQWRNADEDETYVIPANCPRFGTRFVDVSAGPILESAGYVFVAILGYIFLKEKFTKKKIIGMVVLLCGIALFALGGYLPFFNS